MVGTGKAGFEVAQHRVDPPELGQIPGLAATGDDHRMRTSGIGYPVKTREAISQDLTVRIERAVRPAFYGSFGKSLNRGKSRVDGMPLCIHLDCGDKRDFVLGAPSGLATGVFPAQIGIIGLHGTSQRVDLLAFDHGLHQLVVDAPGCGVADTKLAFQRQCKQSRFGLANQIQCQKPGGQGQAGTLKEGSGNQGSLVTTMAALKRPARTAFQNRMLGTVAQEAMKSVRPAGRFQGCSALLFRAKTLHEFGERQSFLKLHTIHRHGTLHCHKCDFH